MSNEPKTTVGTEEKTYYHGGKAVARKFAFASGELVYNLPWMLVSSYLAFFMTDRPHPGERRLHPVPDLPDLGRHQ